MGIAHRLERMADTASGHSRRVAVIGGGPAGLRAALLAAQRGHQVTLYEGAAALGGQLRCADHAAFKWALRRYKDYLIAQVNKHPAIRVLLGTLAEPEAVAAEGYDAVIAACGAVPRVPDIPGVESTPFYHPVQVYGREAGLGHRVVVVGGSETGTETGMYLAEAGHQVTVLTRRPYLAQDAWCVHAYALMKRRWEANPNFTGLTGAVTPVHRPGPGDLPPGRAAPSAGLQLHRALRRRGAPGGGGPPVRRLRPAVLPDRGLPPSRQPAALQPQRPGGGVQAVSIQTENGPGAPRSAAPPGLGFYGDRMGGGHSCRNSAPTTRSTRWSVAARRARWAGLSA